MAGTMIKIDGTYIPDPKSYDFTVQDFDSENSQRNARGQMVRDRVAVKASIKVEFPPLTQAELAQILSLTSGVSFTMEYIDPRQTARKTGTFYVGDRTGKIYRFSPTIKKYEDVAMSFIEM